MCKVIGLTFALSAIIIFYSYIYLALRYGGAKKYIEKISKREYIYISSIFLISSSFIAYMLGKNQFIYYWDCTMHWIPTVSMTQTMFVNPWGTLQTIVNTIGTTDYNWTMPLLYVLPAKIFGCSFSSVVLIVHVFYMCPAYFVLALAMKKQLSLMGSKEISIVWFIALVSLVPFLSAILLRGFLDPPVLMIAAVIIFLSSDFSYDRFDIKWATLMAIGIFSLVIFRRHWAYWVIGLIVSLGVLFLFQLKTDTWRKTFLNYVLNMSYIGLFCVLLLIFPFKSFLDRSLRDYSFIYSAWNASIYAKIENINNAFGNFLVFSLCVIPFLISKNKKIIKYIISNMILILLPIFIMMRVVQMHDAHFYMAMISVLTLFSYAVMGLLEKIKKQTGKVMLLILGSIYLGFNFLCCFRNSTFSIPDNMLTKVVFSNYNYTPYYREDVAEIKKMVNDLNFAVEKYDTDCYICTGTHNLNSSILSLAYAPETLSAVNRLLSGSDVDIRDGFNTNFFDAGIVVIEEKVSQNGTNTSGSYGVTQYLSEQIRNKSSFLGQHYKLLNQYSLQYEGTSTASIYLKISDFEKNDYKALIEFYDKLYPNNPELFSDRIEKYMQNKEIVN